MRATYNPSVKEMSCAKTQAAPYVEHYTQE